MFVHVLNARAGEDLALNGIPANRIERVSQFHGNETIPFAMDAFGNTVIRLPDPLNPVHTVLTIEMKMKV